MRIRSYLLALSLVLVAPSAAFAQAPPTLDAGAAFHEGRKAMKQGNYKKALPLLVASHKADPGRGKLTNIALCEAKLGMVGSATRHIRKLLQQLPPGDQRVALLSKVALEISPRVPYLRVGFAALVAGAVVTLDGETVPVASMGKDIPVDPGKHLIIASVGGSRARQYEVTIAEGGRKTVMVEPAPEPVQETVAQPMAPRRTAWKVGVAALGVGGASLIAGVATGIVAINKDASLDGKCADGHCLPSTAGDLDARRHFANASTAAFVIGGVLATTGVILVATSGRKHKTSDVWVAPTIGAGSFGVRGGF